MMAIEKVKLIFKTSSSINAWFAKLLINSNEHETRVKLALISANHIFFANILFSLKNHVCTHLHRKKAKYVPRTFRNVLFGLSSDWHKKTSLVCAQCEQYAYKLLVLIVYADICIVLKVYAPSAYILPVFFEFNEIRTKTNYSSIRELRIMCVTLNQFECLFNRHR